MPQSQNFETKDFVENHRIGLILIFDRRQNPDFATMKKQKLKEKIIDAVATDATSERLQEIRTAHRKEYLRDYKKSYPKKRISITVSTDEYRRILVKAKAAGKKPTTYIKDLTIQEINKIYLPPKEGQIIQLISELKRIGNNINQVAHRVNTNLGTTQADAMELRAHIKKVHNVVQEKMNIDLVQEIANLLPENPNLAVQIEQLLDNFKANRPW